MFYSHYTVGNKTQENVLKYTVLCVWAWYIPRYN